MACKIVDDDTIQKILSNYIRHRNYKVKKFLNFKIDLFHRFYYYNKGKQK